MLWVLPSFSLALPGVEHLSKAKAKQIQQGGLGQCRKDESDGYIQCIHHKSQPTRTVGKRPLVIMSINGMATRNDSPSRRMAPKGCAGRSVLLNTVPRDGFNLSDPRNGASGSGEGGETRCCVYERSFQAGVFSSIEKFDHR
ncbi:hypothetical protein BGY98DRAFT_933068 [Russula aff. rugulosa BPL654]|nr:hypothetical protein BGY98DRAFT_933068 [Russula aff. rugulosa BPL654]